MTQTIRRELRQKFYAVCGEYIDNISMSEEAASQFIDALADAALEVRGIATAAPKSLDWMLGAGMSSEDIAEVNAKEQAERDLLMGYEKAMGYGTTLDWWGKNADLVALRKFLVMQKAEDIETFAKWCKRQYSKFRPEDAARYPRQVMIFWPMAFEEKSETVHTAKPTQDGKGFYA